MFLRKAMYLGFLHILTISITLFGGNVAGAGWDEEEIEGDGGGSGGSPRDAS